MLNKTFRTEENIQDKIIDAAYQKGISLNKLMVLFKIQNNSGCKNLYQQHKKIAQRVHNLELSQLPDKIEQNARNKIEAIKRTDKPAFTISDLVYSVLIRPALTLSIILLLTFSIGYIVFNNLNSRKQYTKAELLIAQQNLNKSLEIIAKAFAKTEQNLGNEIIKKRVASPLSKGFGILNEFLTGG